MHEEIFNLRKDVVMRSDLETMDAKTCLNKLHGLNDL